MPRTALQATQELAIQLDDKLPSYCPGDIIIGGVVRKVHTVSTRAWVTIRLHGRAKSKLTVRRNNGNNGTRTSHYRGRFNFFAPNETCQNIFDGPVHIPPGSDSHAWPFALTIPTRPSPRSVMAGNNQDYSYLPLNAEYIATSLLPSCFAFENLGWGPTFQGFVEYYLEAEFRQENVTHLSTATLPIVVLASSAPDPFKTFDLKTRTHPDCIKTQRLIPGMEDAELSFRQKTQKLFGSSKVPQFSFSVQVDCPTVIQMQNTIPIPFKIRIIPDRRRTSDIIVDVPQTIVLTSLTMKLEATTSVICDGSFSPHTASGTQNHHFGDKGTVLGLRSPITIPSDPDAKALDVGAFLELSLHPQHASVRGKSLHPFAQVYPSFITFNIKHSHRLRWDLILEMVGESLKVSGEQAISILAAS